MKYIYNIAFSFLLLFSYHFSFAANLSQNTNFQTFLFTDSSNTIGIERVKNIVENNHKLLISTHNVKSLFSPNATYWLYLQPGNIDTNIDYVLAFHKPLSLIEVYPYPFQQASNYGGIFVPGRLKTLSGCNVLLSQSSKGYLVQIQNRLCSNISIKDIELIPAHSFQQQQKKQDFTQGIIQGFIWLMLLYNLMLYLGGKQKIHLFYVLYILFNSLYLLYTFNYSDTFIFRNNYYVNFYLRTFQLTGVFFYIMFLRQAFLTYCSTYSSSIDRKIFHPFAYLVLLLNLIVGSTLFYRIDFFVKLVGIITMSEGMVAIIGFWYFYKGANWFIRIIMIGSVIMIGGGVTSVSTEMFYMPSNDWYYEIGLCIELLLFSYVLNRQYIILIEERYKGMLEKSMLETQLEIKNRELVFQAIQLSAKDEAIASIKAKIKDYRDNQASNLANLRIIESAIDNYKDSNLWKEFELHFNETHPEFYKVLSTHYPDLSQSEIKLCALIKLNLNTKEIASITQKSGKSIEVMRSRIRKKMDLSREESLSQVLINYK